MKTLRILLLLAVTAMLAVVASDFFGLRKGSAEQAQDEPPAIPGNLDSKANRWTWSQSSANQRKVEIHADQVEEIRDTTLLRLKGVELLIYRPDSNSYDRILCNTARFDGETLYSEEQVTVLLGLRRDAPAGAKPTTIRSTGVTFQSKTGVASSDRYTEYEFDGGTGHSMGSFYDSVNHYFRMNSDAYVERQAAAPGQPPLKIRAGQLFYYELDQRIDLKNGASLDRGTQQLQAADAMVFMQDGVVRKITATQAKGLDQPASRVVHFETPQLEAIYSQEQILEHITGQGPSVMTSESGTSKIRASGNHIDLSYEAREGAQDSLLRDTHVRGNAVLEASPAPGADAKKAQLRRISSEVLHVRMDDNSENMEFVETLARGRLELIPAGSQGSPQQLEGERIKMFYTAGNRMEKLQATGNVEVERAANPDAKPGKGQALKTYSGGLIGDFDPASGDMSRMRQWTNFRFEQGDRKGSAQEAQFEVASNQVEMKNEAQVWDPSGRTTADQITLDQNSGDFSARGSVSSVYQENQPAAAKKGAASQGEGGELFTPSKPVYATAQSMSSNQRTGLLEYHGKARLWQGADRVEAEHIRIERRQRKLSAKENVISVITDKNEEAVPAPKNSGPPTPGHSRIEVHADAMLYDEATRHVAYSGSVEMNRETLRVKSQQLDAWLAPAAEDGESRLEKAEARDQVEVAESAGGANGRRGFGDRAEYHPEEEKVILEGQPARVVNVSQDSTRGSELTYYLNDDRLLVQGSPQERTYSLRRKQQR